MTGEIIGREGELSAVQAFLDRPAEGTRALVLEGEPGIGKSTIWLAGLAAARERSFGLLVSRPAETERTLPNLVLGDLFGEIAPDVLAALPTPRRRAFEAALLRDEPDLPVDPRALGVAIVTLLPMLADGRPLVLAIDDDQWLDPSSAATLGFALRRSLHQPLLLLLSRRIDGAAAPGLEGAIDPTEVERLRVGPLSAGAVQALVRLRLGIAFPRPMLLRLHELSGGNPFHALELARAQASDPARDLALPLAVPPSLERLVGARLGALGEPTRRALLFVAAHGRLPVGLLRALKVTPESLAPALAANVVVISAEAIGFTHPLLASAAYQGAAAEDRRAVHRLLAASLDDPVERGRHLALGADGPDGALAAALESAAAVARDRGLPIASVDLAEHALRLTPLDADEDRHHRAMGAVLAHIEAGEGNRAREIAADLLAQAQPGRQRAEALVLRLELEHPSIAVGLLIDALREAAGAPGLRATIHASLADSGRATEGRAWAERHAWASLRLAERLDDDVLRANALSMLAPLCFDRGDPQGLELAERAHRLATRTGDLRQVKLAAMSVCLLLTWSGSPERARERLEREFGFWSDRDELVRRMLLWSLALVEISAGRWGVASEYAREAQDIGVQYGMELPQDLFPPALIALYRGEFGVARAHSRRGIALLHGQLMPAHAAILGSATLGAGTPQPDLPIWSRPSRRPTPADSMSPTCAGGAMSTSRRSCCSAGSTRPLVLSRTGRPQPSGRVGNGSSPRRSAVAGSSLLRRATLSRHSPSSRRRPTGTRRLGTRSGGPGRSSRSARSGAARAKSARPESHWRLPWPASKRSVP